MKETGDRKAEPTDSPEIPDRRVTSDKPQPPVGGTVLLVKSWLAVPDTSQSTANTTKTKQLAQLDIYISIIYY